MGQGVLKSKPYVLTDQDRIFLRHIHGGKYETFAFKDWELGNILFNVTIIRMLIAAEKIPYQAIKANLTADYAEHIRKFGGIDKEFISKDFSRNLNAPSIAVMFPTNEAVLIDGNNRVIRRYQSGLKKFKLILIPWPYWRPCSYWDKDGELGNIAQEQFALLPERNEIT